MTEQRRRSGSVTAGGQQLLASRVSVRKPSGKLSSLFLLAILILLFPWQVATLLANDAESDPLKIIELYTSHGCSSCPAADSLLGELLAEDEQLLALEFHVDYWNTLVHGNDGSFTDPFSSASHSERQREYNAAALSGRPGVYTPQAIVNGRVAAVGSNRRHIAKALARPVRSEFDIRILPDGDSGRLSIAVNGSLRQRMALNGANIWLARYLDTARTQITGGENSGKTLTNRHVVTALSLLGKVAVHGDMTFGIQSPGGGEGCVVLVQEATLTPIHAAAGCP